MEDSMLKSATYRAAARKLRMIADQFDARSKPKTPRQDTTPCARAKHSQPLGAGSALTSAVYGLSRYAKALADRHRRKIEGRSKQIKRTFI